MTLQSLALNRRAFIRAALAGVVAPHAVFGQVSEETHVKMARLSLKVELSRWQLYLPL